MALLDTFFFSLFWRKTTDHATRPALKRGRCFLGGHVGILLFVLLGLGSAKAQSKEYQIKAAFLYNFAQFVKWPPSSLADPSTPFRIGILGDDPFEGALEKMVRGESIEGHKFVVQRAKNLSDLKDCQIVFISRSEEDHMAQILSQLASMPILAVSEVRSFAQDGGMINFYLQNDKVRFEINPVSARRAGLKVSSQLLSLGKIIQPSSENN